MAAGPFPAVRKLAVHRFRNYVDAALEVNAPAVVLTGPNGAGKTNLLEALSFLAPGRGLRAARLSEVDRLAPSNMPAAWAVSAEIDDGDGPVRIGTGRDPAAAGDRRLVRIDGVPARGQTVLGDHLAVTWLTPAMDRLFAEGGGGRRRFLDRLVFAFDPAHAGRVARLDHAQRERGRLLRAGVRDDAWLAALEETIAASGVAVAAARREMVIRLDQACAAAEGAFPKARVRLVGPLEAGLAAQPAVEVEERLRINLRDQRERGERGFDGPQKSDLEVIHVAKDMPAGLCSTGEQKALLIAVMLAHARLHHAYRGRSPLLLLDEVAAHLDAARRGALFAAVGALGGQVWYTGTEPAAFDGLAGLAAFFDIVDGVITPR